MTRITASKLAQELGLAHGEFLKLSDKAGVHRVAMGATYSPGEADRVRQFYAQKRENERAERERRQARDARVAALLPPTRREQVQVETSRPSIPGGCQCCGLPMPPDPYAADGPRRCSKCAPHHAIDGEDAARRQARLEDHDRRLPAAFADLWHRAEVYRADRTAGYRSRNGWRAALVHVIDSHEERPAGRCTCGQKYPCVTLAALDHANRGIAVEVYRILSLRDREREQALWGDLFWSYSEDDDATRTLTP